MTYFVLVAGMAILLIGGELLVRNASRLALTVGMSPLVVGLTIVAFGTSAPELMTSIYNQWVGQADVAMGNVVGSNIFNVLVILGLSALFAPLSVDARLLKVDVPLVIVVSLGAFAFALSGTMARWEAGVLLLVFLGYVAWLLWASPNTDASQTATDQQLSSAKTDGDQPWKVAALLTLLGLALVIVGGRLFVTGAVDLARALHIDEAVIGLTVVAFGTSLPELVTSVMASLRGHRDLAVGNVVGSNFFNLTGVLGVSGLVGANPMKVEPSVLAFDLPVMVATAVVCLPVMFSGARIQRWEGGILLVYYISYVSYLVLSQTGHIAAPTFGAAMIWYGLPLTILTLFVIGYRDHR